MRNLGVISLNPSSSFISEMQTACEKFYQKKQSICNNIYFLINGYNSEVANQTTINVALQRLPYGASVWQVLHLAQIKRTGVLASYKSLINSSHRYELSKVTVPMAVMYTPHDQWSHPNDVKALILELPNVYHQEIMQAYTNNLDFIYGNNLQALNQKIKRVLQVSIEEKSDEQWKTNWEE